MNTAEQNRREIITVRGAANSAFGGLFLLFVEVMPIPVSRCGSRSGGWPLAVRGGGCGWSEHPSYSHFSHRF
jgi:hypothetical protein